MLRRFSRSVTNTRIVKRQRRQTGLDPRFMPKVPIKRSALLLATSLATGFIVGVAMAPKPAMAQQAFQYGPGPGPVVYTNLDDCIVGAGVDCIDVTTTANYGTANITNEGVLIAGDRGFDVETQGNFANVIIDNNETIFSNEDAIRGVTGGYDSNITINNDSDLTSIIGDGIEGFSTDTYADISVTNSGDVLAAGADGIYLHTQGYSAEIDINNSGAIGLNTLVGRYGIYAYTLDEDSSIQVQNSAAIRSTSGGIRLKTDEDQSGIEVDNYVGGDITTTDGHGIYAKTYGFQSGIDINNDAVIDANGVGSDGISTYISDAIGGDSYDARTYINNSAAITADDDAIEAISNNPGSSEIVIVNTAALNAGDLGIVAYATGDNSFIDIDNRATITSASTGIYANQTSVDRGDVDVESSGNINAQGNAINARTNAYLSNIDIMTSGAMTSGAGNTGIVAFNYGYDGTIDIAVNGNVNAGSDGVYAQISYGENGSIEVSQGAGSTITSTADGISTNATYAGFLGMITITANGVIDAGSQGIYIGSTYTALINANGSVDADDQAIFIGNANDADIFVNGASNGATGGIQVNASNSLDIDVGVGGRLTADNDLAINAVGPADANIFIGGYVRGYMQLDADDDVYVEQGGEWRATDTTDFDYFGAGLTEDRVFNNGTIRTVELDPLGLTEYVYFDNLEEFHNGGAGGDGLITMVNGQEGDLFLLNYNEGAGLVFYGDAGSTLAVDARLATGEQADRFYVFGDADEGSTAVVVNNVNEIGSSPDFGDDVFGEGIAVVIVSGATDQEAFGLIDGPIEAGFFTWDLYLDTTDTRYGTDDVHELRTIGLSSAAYAMPIAVTAAQDIWHETTGVWLDRQADLRMQLNSGMAMSTADLPMEEVMVEQLPGASVTPGVWAKGVGVWADRDDEATIEGPPEVTFDLSSDQRTYGFIGGVDFGREGASGDDAFLVGLMGGYLWSKLDFDEAAAPDFDFEGPTVGVYATFLKGGFFLDALVKADFLDLDIDDAGGLAPGDEDDSTDVLNLGARVDAGYQFRFGSGFFLEPQATLAYVHSDFDDVDIFGGTVEFEDGESLRGRLGARIGAVFQTANYSISPDLTVSVWQEFSGDNEATITGFAGPAGFFDVEDDGGDTFGEVSVGLSAAGHGGWSGFLKGDYTFSDDYNSAAVNGGVRFNW